MQDMRDFSHAKAMARTLRAAVAAQGLKITIGQSLELIAKVVGVADWNTLAAAIRAAVPPSPNGASTSLFPTAERILGPGPIFRASLNRHWAALSLTPITEGMTTQRRSISCSPS
jgi:hypothetical protein